MIGRVILGVVIGAGIGGIIGYFGKCPTGLCPLTRSPYSGATYGAILGLILTLMTK